MYHNKENIILASGSPRRRDYLHNLGLKFRVLSADIDETQQPQESASDLVLRLATEKGRAVAQLHPNDWIISADTIVSFSGRILGKPQNAQQAVDTLMLLSGHSHQVYTSFSLIHQTKEIQEVQSVMTKVTFSAFSRQTALAYVATQEPLDKAGSYGIQGKGAALVEKIDGSYSNVVGLPLVELIALLEKYRII